jgi:maleylacetoacetate isomerase
MLYYGYFRSSASFRLRIALNLKGLAPQFKSIHLRKGDQFHAEYTRLNVQEQVPTLITDQGDVLVQSPAILEWLEETHPNPPLLPRDPVERARVRALAVVVGCDIHPIDNLRVLTYLQKAIQVSEGQFEDWYNHWIALGFRGLEAMLAGHPKTGTYCHGEAPTLADVYLVPQVFNSFRFKLPLAPYPSVKRIFDNCMKLAAFDQAQPKNQPDFEA